MHSLSLHIIWILFTVLAFVTTMANIFDEASEGDLGYIYRVSGPRKIVQTC
jgi:hypothetical protein